MVVMQFLAVIASIDCPILSAYHQVCVGTQLSSHNHTVIQPQGTEECFPFLCAISQ